MTEMAGDISKRQDRIKQTERGTGCQHEEIFNVIHTLRTFCMQHIINLKHPSYVPFLEQWVSEEHPKSSGVS